MPIYQTSPNHWTTRPPAPAPTRSTLPCPYVISDIMEPTEQVDGRFYTSKRAFRAVGRALGLTEVGNEKFKPKTRASADPAVKRARHDALRRAFARKGER